MIAQKASVLPNIEENTTSKKGTKGYKALTCKRGHDTSSSDSRTLNNTCRQCATDYEQSPKGKERRKQYKRSSRGRQLNYKWYKVYRQTDAGRLSHSLANKKYIISDKGRIVRQRKVYSEFKRRLARRIEDKRFRVQQLERELLNYAEEIRNRYGKIQNNADNTNTHTTKAFPSS